MATRWGIVCAGNIANDLCAALELLSPDDHKIVAVASRSIERAKVFAERFGIPKAYGCYEDLAKDPDVEIAQIATITSEHHKLAKLMMNHGKHVMVETPMTTDVELTKDLVKIARDKKLFLMEGMWSAFFPVINKVRAEIHSIGEVQLVCARMGIDLTDDVANISTRLTTASMGGGALYECCSYIVELATIVFRERPEKVTCDGSLHPSGVDENVCIILRYSGGRFAQISCGMVCGFVDSAEIMGTKGAFQIEAPFWCPTKMKTPTEEFEAPLKEGKHPFNFINSAGLVYEAEHVRKCLQKGLTECDLVPHEHSIIAAEVTAEVLKQLGVKKL